MEQFGKLESLQTNANIPLRVNKLDPETVNNTSN